MFAHFRNVVNLLPGHPLLSKNLNCLLSKLKTILFLGQITFSNARTMLLPISLVGKYDMYYLLTYKVSTYTEKFINSKGCPDFTTS